MDYPSSGSVYYFNDLLWVRAGCTNGTCCNGTYIYSTLVPSSAKSDHKNDVEAWICTHGPYNKRSTLIDQLELYVQ